MSQIKENLTQLIGNTPLFKASRYSKEAGLETPLLAKLEYLNPAGSVKDRIAYAMILDAEEKGLLKPGATIIEPTSGNTGIGLAAVAAARGYQAIFTLPETMSVERRKLLAAYGAKLVLTDGSKGMKGAIARADELNKEIPGSVILGQFVNPANPAIHYKTTHPPFFQRAPQALTRSRASVQDSFLRLLIPTSMMKFSLSRTRTLSLKASVSQLQRVSS